MSVPVAIPSPTVGVLERPWDDDANGSVGVSDFLILLGIWGPCSPVGLGDLDGDGNVGASDLVILLANWGPRP